MSFRPQRYYNYHYTHIQNGIHRTIITNEGSTDNGLAAQQPFPNSVRIKFSAPPLKRLENNYRFSKKFFIILLFVLIGIFLFEKHSNVFFSYDRWHKPEIPWKGPKEFEIDPKEFYNLGIAVSGHATQGNLFITRSSEDTSSIDVKAKVLLSHESLQHSVQITTSYNSSDYKIQVKTPEFCDFPNCISVNINITFPRYLKNFGKFFVNIINLDINNDDLRNITFDSINWKLNPSIHVKNLKSREISVCSRGNIAGNYCIDESLLLQTSDAQINAITESFSNSTPKSIKLFTSNSAIQGSFPSAHLFEAHTSNGKIDLNITNTSQNKNGKVILNTTNGSISGVYDVNNEWHASTSNGDINVKLNLINLTELIRISGMTSNGKIDTLISDSYKGRFHLQTSNGKTTIEGSNNDINFNNNTKSLKNGHKGKFYNNNELSLFSSNGKINLTFF